MRDDDDDDDALYLAGAVARAPRAGRASRELARESRDEELGEREQKTNEENKRRRRTSMMNAVRARFLMMSSGEDTDSDSEDDARAEAERRRIDARSAGEDDVKDVVEMLDELASARDVALGIAASATNATGELGGGSDADAKANGRAASRESDGSDGTKASIVRAVKEIGSGAAAFLSSPTKMFVGGGNDDEAPAGYIVARVRAVRTLLGLFVRVRLETGHNLLAMDAGNTSDPYVVVTILDSSGKPIPGKVYKTAYRLKTLNPVFDETFYMGDAKLEFKNCSLRFQVWDFDLASSDDLMGTAVLPLNCFAGKLKREKSIKKELTARLSAAPASSAEDVAKESVSGDENLRFKDGSAEWIHKGEIRVRLNLVNKTSGSHIYQEALAMLSFAKELLNPRNLGRSLAKSSVGTWFNDKIEAAVDIGKRRALRAIDGVIEEKKGAVVKAVKADRDMPVSVGNYIAGVAVMYVTDIQKTIMRDLAMRLKITDAVSTQSHKSKMQLRKKKKRNFIVVILRYLRAWYLYNEVPYDMTIWGKIRNPYWWFLLLAKLYFGLGIQAAMFFLRLALVDRTDEWQMFEFITSFKGIQFITGTISIFSGVFAFIQCAGIVDRGLPHTCNKAGPWFADMESCTIGTEKCVNLNFASYLFRILMCWYAFRCLRLAFAFGRAIAGDELLVGGRIEITFVKPGDKYLGLGSVGTKLLNCGRAEKPLARFKRIVEKQMVVIRASREKDPAQQHAPGMFKQFHYVKRIAKVKGYDASTDIHTVYFRDDRKRKLQDIDLNLVTYRVVKLKEMEPRRLQRILLGYEILTFVITIGIAIRFLSWVDWGRGETWQIYEVVFWSQTFYNLLSFPFIFTVIPGLNKLVCHATKTGYDMEGTLRKFQKRATFAPVGEEPHPRSRIIPAFYPLNKRIRI